MDATYDMMLLAGGLLAGGILAGVLSQRIGAPLMLVFLALGMAMGKEGPGGVAFESFQDAFLIASMALAVILFDGGLRASFATIRRELTPSLTLATLGVLITAGGTGLAAHAVLSGDWLDALLIGAVVASTDAAAVFLLLHQRGRELRQRVAATLELESGLNDPMAVFLTITLVTLAQTGMEWGARDAAWLFAVQMGLGLLAGLAGGAALAFAVNRLELAPGLYPVFVTAGALVVFALAQKLGGSGFLAAYVAGVVVGNQRLRADRLIRRFHDGLSWVAQIVLLVMLGMLVTPSSLGPDLAPGIAIAVMLIFVARPLAVFVCLAPFRYRWDERLFIAWVGLRGAVPLVLATIAVLSGLPESEKLFNIAFIVVIASLLLQGWTVPWLARALDMDIAPAPEPDGRLDIDLPSRMDRDVLGYTVRAGTRVDGRDIDAVAWPKRTRVLTVLRDGSVVPRESWGRFTPGDFILLITPPEHAMTVDRLFLQSELGPVHVVDFEFEGTTPYGAVAALYDLPHDEADGRDVAAVIADKLGTPAEIGDVVQAGTAGLVVLETDAQGLVLKAGLRLDAPSAKRRARRAWRRLTGEVKRRGLDATP